MKTLRLNLLIYFNLYPEVHTALNNIEPRKRAEYARKLLERGLLYTHKCQDNKTSSIPSGKEVHEIHGEANDDLLAVLNNNEFD